MWYIILKIINNKNRKKGEGSEIAKHLNPRLVKQSSTDLKNNKKEKVIKLVNLE